MFRAFSIFCVLMVLFPVPSFGAVGNGDAIPAELPGFETLKGERGAVLVFVRSVDWCPYCQVQLLNLKDVGKDIEGAGYNVVIVSYDTAEKQKAFGDKYRFPYAMVSDPNSHIIKAFGILDESYKGRDGIYGIPQPHVYIVSKDGFVQDVLAEDGYKVRPSAELILERVRGL